MCFVSAECNNGINPPHTRKHTLHWVTQRTHFRWCLSNLMRRTSSPFGTHNTSHIWRALTRVSTCFCSVTKLFCMIFRSTLSYCQTDRFFRMWKYSDWLSESHETYLTSHPFQQVQRIWYSMNWDCRMQSGLIMHYYFSEVGHPCFQ